MTNWSLALRRNRALIAAVISLIVFSIFVTVAVAPVEQPPPPIPTIVPTDTIH